MKDRRARLSIRASKIDAQTRPVQYMAVVSPVDGLRPEAGNICRERVRSLPDAMDFTVTFRFVNATCKRSEMFGFSWKRALGYGSKGEGVEGDRDSSECIGKATEVREVSGTVVFPAVAQRCVRFQAQGQSRFE